MVRVVGYAVLLSVALGCSKRAIESSSASSAQIKAVVFNASGAPTVQFSVPDMMCEESCAVKVKEILVKEPGAKDVIVDFGTKTATVAIEEGTFDPQQAIAALVDHHFDQAALKDGAVSSAPTAAVESEATPPAPAR